MADSKKRPRSRVDFEAEEISGSSVTVGRRIIKGNVGNVPPEPDEGDANVRVKVRRVKDAEVDVGVELVIGGNGDADEALDKLAKLIAENLKLAEEVAGLREIVQDLKAEAAEPQERRNENKVKRLLGRLQEYIAITAMLGDQLEKAEKLFEVIRRIFLGG